MKYEHLHQLLVRLLVCIAMLCTSFIHIGHTAHLKTAIELEAYRLPDGTLPIICLTNDDNSKNPYEVSHTRCDLCRATDDITLLQSGCSTSDFEPVKYHIIVHYEQQQQSLKTEYYVNNPARGPPHLNH